MADVGSSIFAAPMQKSIYDTDQNDIVDRAEVAVPSAHASSHVDGTDDIRDATDALKGLATSVQITVLEANAVHSAGDGSDHANVASNTAASHTQGTDPGLDTGGANAITAAQAKAAYTHSQLAQIAELENLTQAEVQQLENINSATITTTQWGYLGAMNQEVKTSDSPTFAGMELSGNLVLQDDIALVIGSSSSVSLQYVSASGLIYLATNNKDYTIESDATNYKYWFSAFDASGFDIGIFQAASKWNDVKFGANSNIFNDYGENVDLIVKTSGDAVCLTVDGALDRVGIGIAVNTHAGKLHIDQASTSGVIPVLVLDQADESEGFINFIGSDRGIIAAATASVSSVRVELGGTVYRLALYANA